MVSYDLCNSLSIDKKKSPCRHNSVLCERKSSLCTVRTTMKHLVNFFPTSYTQAFFTILIVVLIVFEGTSYTVIFDIYVLVN